jgi:hypothetical protein
MKRAVLCGGLLLALYVVGRLGKRVRGIPARPREGLQPRIPPCTYVHNDVVFHLN